MTLRVGCIAVGLLSFVVAGVSLLRAQTAEMQGSAVISAQVPPLIQFANVATDEGGNTLSGLVSVTFSLYEGQRGGEPLWVERQNVQLEATGHYSVQLGVTKRTGVPSSLFSSGQARWLGVRIAEQPEEGRVLLVSVPYALKAADAETIGGLPASAFVRAARPDETASGVGIVDVAGSPSAAPPPATITGSGTVNFLPLFTGAATIGNSALFQSGASPTAKLGINTSAPAAALDVKGTGIIRGAFTLPALGVATAAAGKNSQPQNFTASAFNSGSSTATTETFRWQAEPTGNNTASTGGSLNLLFGQGSSAAAETGLKIASNGRITFASGQTFPGSGGGTVTSVALSAPGSDFNVTGSPITGSGTLGLSWKVAPASTNTASAIVKRDSAGGFSAGSISAKAITATSSSSAALIQSTNSSGPGISGHSVSNYGVVGVTEIPGYAGVSGKNTASDGYGVLGQGRVGVGAYGDTAVYAGGTTYGVQAYGADSGVYAINPSGSVGVRASGGTYGVWGETNGFDGVHALAHTSASTGLGAINDGGGDAIYAAVTNGGVAGYFSGDVQVSGTLSKAGGSFKIDHPLDPANKYLYHSFVESPDMKNIYDGTATTDANGEAVIMLPEWFGNLNRDFRYQLTAIGAPGPNLYVAEEISGNHFKIAGSTPGARVSWQVTGIRHDAWANAHRIPVEQAKPEKERGFYLHPELFGAPAEKSIARTRHPEPAKQAERPPQPPRLVSTPASVQR